MKTNPPIRVGIIGATGYTALEAARLLQSHPGAELVAATSRADEGKPLAEIHPSLAGRCSVAIETFDAESIAAKCDVVMCCLPHGASAETVRQLVDTGVRVIDFSADFRLSSLEVYEKWYGVKHPWPERIGNVAYGMPEFFAAEIAKADVVANPGCYPTSAILPLAPLVKAGLVECDDIIIDSKSGVSGAGRSAKVATLYCETNESIAAYGVGTHRHGPEIDDLVHRIAGSEVSTIFTPHLTPMDRGILSTIYVRPKSASADAVMQCWQEAYRDHPFVSPVDHLPATKHVAGTNFVQMSVRVSGDRLVLVCVIDNLAKGASGAAIQNMNVMFGLEQTIGLN
ncbi:N-acetyl-gamma-glutamyl-phosphate reductase [Rubripirellula obstinata]|uniref:N-acetyl-gamma-glutamyl-phosphate reductase n=1 Tax=Rubripirellula obstinata TaxID=406547 RepID=A0A5B1CHM5_9BACT|nr:N-acetyl-gamma-glutamyl-phosphate reductase [Rubripirellula obstinata]KAA1259702.1 N-acetyl-gamma-glutamyl-phosphate reductase [Rubripirellula obstinata]